MKKLFILFAVFLVFLSFAVPCFATNEGLYGHYISSGKYIFNEELVVTGSSRSIEFDFYVDGVLYYGVASYPDVGEVFFEVRRPVTGNSDLQLVYSTDTGWIDETFRIIEVNDLTFYNSSDYYWWISNTSVAGDYDGHLVDGILSVFVGIGSWLGNAFSSLQAIFFVDGALTLVGTLSVLGLALAVILLLFNMLRSFLKFR